MVALSHESKFQQDVKYKVITLKNKKRLFKDVTRGDPFVIGTAVINTHTLGSPLSRSKI